MIDRDDRRLGYFHNAGYFEADGEDYDGLLRVERIDRGLELLRHTSS